MIARVSEAGGPGPALQRTTLMLARQLLAAITLASSSSCGPRSAGGCGSRVT